MTKNSSASPVSQTLSRPQSTSDFSAGSGASGAAKRRKKKNELPPISLDDIFNQVSDVTSSNLNPPPARIVLTPRSAEVCLKLGVNPEVLKIRDIDSFWEPGIDPAVQRIRHEAYVQRRYDLMKQCRLERKRMALAEFESATNLKAADTLTPEMILKQQEEQNSTLIQMELQRIEKMRRRQQKELESMIQFELNRAKLAQDMERRISEAKKKDELRKKQQEKRMRLMAEERRLRELQKVALEEAEEQRRLAMAREAHEKERQLAEEQERRSVEAKRRAREEEVERKRRQEEHRQQVEQFFSEEQMRLRQRLDSMQSAEKKKQDAILRKQAEHAEMLRKRREAIEKRIEMNVQMAKAIEEKKKTDFLSKQEQFESIRAEHLRRQEEERQLKAQELELQEQRRRMILMEQKREDEMRAEQMLGKFEEEEEHLQEVQQRRQKDLSLQRERKVLKTQLKLENVQRVMRVGEYKRMSTLKKIQSNDERIRKMLEQRLSLVEERRRAAIATKQQKESIGKVMEEVRTNASKASQIITKVLSGKISLDQLATGALAGGGTRRAKSAGQKREGNGARGCDGGDNSSGSPSIAAVQMGLGGRQSKSAGEVADGAGAGGEGGARYSIAPNALSSAQPYVSPYAIPAGEL